MLSVHKMFSFKEAPGLLPTAMACFEIVSTQFELNRNGRALCYFVHRGRRISMCAQCDAFNQTIARYRRLKEQVNDVQVHQAAARLVAELQEKIAALHSDK